MLGYSNTLYVSENNIYIAYRKNVPYNDYRERSQERFFSVVVPLLPRDMQDKINSYNENPQLDAYQKWEQIAVSLEEYYNSLDKDDLRDITRDIEEAIGEYEAKLEAERAKTIIHRIEIDAGRIEHKAKGEVFGDLLNQFSMDEFEENLRVATTTTLWTRQSTVQYNNVYVLNEGMNTIGKIEKIAPDERIYSTRFLGNRLYMVTFKRVDPLFVIGLDNPQKPEVLGELKIPGFSDYLHPYDATHIIGILM